MPRIALIPMRSRLHGGPKSFHAKLSAKLSEQGIEVTDDLIHGPFDTILVINCPTKGEIARLLYWKWRQVRIVQRLGIPNNFDGLNPGITLRILIQWWNHHMQFIRSAIADHVVYQTGFTRKKWLEAFGTEKVPCSIIPNGLDLRLFSPSGEEYRSKSKIVLLSVEGTQGMDPFDTAFKLALTLQKDQGLDVELLVFGSPWKESDKKLQDYPFVKFMGFIDNRELPFYYRGSHIYIYTEKEAACPNSLMEALACGTPVVGYETQPLPELLAGKGGRLLPLENGRAGRPHMGKLAAACLEILGDRQRFSHEARRVAEEKFDLDRMVAAFLEILLP